MKRMPSLFIGHGSPMNAVAQNRYTEWLSQLGKTLPLPKAILCVSAHWMTSGFFVTSMNTPKTIHDFYGFPKELFEIQYPAPGDPELARRVQALNSAVQMDPSEWGFDHGAWSVLRHLYPEAKIPVVQLSIDMQKSAAEHFALGQSLRPLRDEGVLILGSGNIVHNLRKIQWEHSAPAYDWAMEFDIWFQKKLENGDHQALIHDYLDSESGRLSVPTPDHYLPIATLLGTASDSKASEILYTEMQNASISMLSFSLN